MISKTGLLSLLLLVGCSSTKLIDTWKSPEVETFKAYKILVVGMAQDEDVRTAFESTLVQKLQEKGIEASRSLDLFRVAFTPSKISGEALDAVEQLLLDKGFDAILFTKLTGVEHKKTLREKMYRIETLFSSFSGDYLAYQHLEEPPEPFEAFPVYHAETAVYCICVEKARELLWRGNIAVIRPKNIEKATTTYIKRVTEAMEAQKVIF